MSKIALSGNASGTGTLTIAAPNTSTDRTLTLPDNTGTLVTTGSTAAVTQAMLASNVAGNGPLLLSGNAPGISVPNVTTTVFTTYNASVVDTAGAFNVSNGRFTPQVAGYYLIIASVGFDSNGVSGSSISAQILKNNYVVLYSGIGTNTTVYPRLEVISMASMNGTTDYITVGAYQNGGSTVSSVYASMQAVLIRAA